MKALLAGVLAVCLLASAGALAQQPAGSSTEPVRLGLILDMSSVYADVTGAGSETAARMAVEDFGGKVLGRPIEVLVADHRNKPDIAATIANKWFDVDHVTALMDVAASSPALAAMSVAKSHNKIIMMSGPGATSITNEACIPTAVHYAYNTYALAHTTGKAVVAQGGKSWFFLAADYTFGQQLEADTASVVKSAGGQVLGDARAPIATSDYSSYLLQAQQSKAQVVGFALAGNDLVNSIKQAAEFGLNQGGQRLTGLLVYINDIHSLGLGATQGMTLSSAFYWDRNDGSRQWAQPFFKRLHKMPNMSQAGVYSATMHYLRAVQAAGTTETALVMRKMRDTPVDDFFAQNGHIRADGLMVHDMYLFQVKTPAESKSPWDLYKLAATIPGDQAFQPLSESKCPLVKAGAAR
ncbi:MAG: ABC transporter substrate-binding protein [Pseudomonadota bacterium]|nr:ABC transporter substrate-binding protein [Pseudomonadota bacterium]